VEYTAGADKISEIYDGFLYLGEYYKKKSGKDLKFVPIYIDEQTKSLYEGEGITCPDFKENRDGVREYLKNKINGIS
jgi:hypothetical protein